MEAERPRIALKPDTLHDFDVLAYDLKVAIDLAGESLTGTTAVLLRSDAALLDSIYLHLVQLSVDSVWMGVKSLPFIHASGVLSIDLDTVLSQDDTFSINVAYRGHPGNEGAGGFGGFWFTATGAYSMGVGLYTDPPSMGRYWFPCYDEPYDKAEFDMSFKVPLGRTAVSNGILVDTIPDYAESTMTYVWSEHHPTSTYLVAVSVYDYVVVPDSVYPWIYNYVYPADSSKAVTSFRNVHRMMDAFQAVFPPYQFDKFSFVETPKGDMEHQTCVSHLNWLINGFNDYDWILAHELAHHWWGDWVTVGDWRDIWLSEGFATYCEAVYQEYLGGWQAYHDYVVSDIMNYYLASGELFPIYDPLAMWGATSYEKGASVLHMLRHVVGDSTFFTILNAYGNQYAFSNAVTPDFQAVCESLHGQSLDWFFGEWIYDWAYPQYVYTFWQAGPDTVEVLVTQEQTMGPVFVMPVDIRLGTDTGDTTVVAWVDESPETLVIVFPGANTDSFGFDPNDWILKLSRNEPGVAERETHFTRRTGRTRVSAYPNPFNATCRFAVHRGRAASNEPGTSLIIYDLAGRPVRSFVLMRDGEYGRREADPEGYEFVWDGRDDHGSLLPCGVYFYGLDDRQTNPHGKLVLLR
jgi:aminopeptidase N